MEYIINNSETKLLILENQAQVSKWLETKANCPKVSNVICIESNKELPEGVISWSEWIERGQKYRDQNENAFESLCQENEIDQLATILYTSGTTGLPKGVVLTHRQVISELADIFPPLGLDDTDTTISFLPYAHVLGRVESWGNVYCGYTMAYAESIEKLKRNFCEVSPTAFIGVPRIFEKIYNGILSQVESNPVKKRIFDWSVKVGKKVSVCKQKRQPIPVSLLPQYLLAKRLVFDPIKEKLGGRLRFAMSGGAPLSQEIASFFHAAGLLILEGYGLTETTAAITVNTPFDYEFGTVGKALANVEIKIAEDGEILVKSDKVMKEYYNNPEATKEIIKGGYFYTGDIGEFTAQGHLKITDRKKDLIKTSGGKYVAPQKLENLLKLHKLISNVLIHGDQRKYIVALVTLDPDSLRLYAKDQSFDSKDLTSLSREPSVKEEIRRAVAEANSQLASYESIKSFDILPSDFTVESGELTPSLKVKRRVCDEKYREQIDRMYGLDRSSL